MNLILSPHDVFEKMFETNEVREENVSDKFDFILPNDVKKFVLYSETINLKTDLIPSPFLIAAQPFDKIEN